MNKCNGLCLYGADIGVPEYHDVAYPHPDCEKHGAPMHDEHYAHDDYNPDGPWPLDNGAVEA